MVDPSHGTGRLSLIAPMAMSSVVAGADGVVVEVHVDPSNALSDAAQQLKPDEFAKLTSQLRKLKKKS